MSNDVVNKGSISGVVKDSGGGPVSGAEVLATPQDVHYAGHEHRPVRTDREGRFRIDNLHEGHLYTVTTSPFGIAASRRDINPAAPGTIILDPAINLTIQPAEGGTAHASE